MSVPNPDAWKELCNCCDKHRLYHAMHVPCPCFTIKWSKIVEVSAIGSTPPPESVAGQLWWRGSSLYVFDGMQWQLVK